ncbi:S8 family peptidase [Lacisediminihabitans changchengi]|uniref:S8 family serine peptidase n=1 Tax=Lacisediminihabitans changchengi TaxID=2787634 RepID=A0A934W482_9MICO|nr:S8 family serine peptidase [Lacisediminihabitans changchengi]MBK4347235.1 S8 family serine peptidase [Lacisediminihabitans changchengi]
MSKRGRRGAVVIAVVFGLFASLLVASPASADSIRDREYWLSDYGFTAAWNTTRGAGATVAVIDTGVDGSVPDLVGAVTGGTDVSGVGSPNGQTPVGDDNAHGTMVASMLAGRGHGSGAGVIGVAPAANILAVSVGFGVGAVDSDDQIAQAVRWSVDHGADIINMSLTRNTLDWPPSWDAAFLYAMQHNVIVVAAAGNRGSGTTEVGAPATMPGVVVVAGVDRNGKASFDASSQGITLTVSAPSEDLVGAGPGSGYFQWAGTSGATPIVSGLLALIVAAHPGISAGNAINRLTATARPAGDAIVYGSGLIDAAAAVTANVPSVRTNPADDLKEWIRLNRRAEATAQPAPSTTAKPTKVPEAGAAPVSPFGSVLPSIGALRDAGLPLVIYLVFAGLLSLVIRGAVRARRGQTSGRTQGK